MPMVTAVKSVSLWVWKAVWQRTYLYDRQYLIDLAELDDHAVMDSDEKNSGWQRMYVDAELKQFASLEGVPEEEWAHVHLESWEMFSQAMILMCDKGKTQCLRGKLAEVYYWTTTLHVGQLRTLWQTGFDQRTV
eukprot:gene33445-42925_t